MYIITFSDFSDRGTRGLFGDRPVLQGFRRRRATTSSSSSPDPSFSIFSPARQGNPLRLDDFSHSPVQPLGIASFFTDRLVHRPVPAPRASLVRAQNSLPFSGNRKNVS